MTVLITVGAAGLTAGCCSRSHGNSAAYSAPAYSESRGGTTDAYQSSSGNSSSQTSSNTVIPLYKESVSVGTRQVDDGTVRLRKVVKTETVNEPVQLRRETVVIDRVPAATGRDTSSDSQAFQEQEITIQLHHDEPVIQTQVVLNGQVVAQTRSDLQQTNIQQQIRSEDVAIDKGNAQNVIVSQNLSSPPASDGAMGGGGDIGGQSGGMGAASPITDPATLTASSNPGALDGRPVELTNTKIDQVDGRMISIKDDSGQPVFIRLSESMDSLKPGDAVNITGTAKRVSPTSATSMADLSAQMTQALKGQQVYIDAQTVELAK